MDLTVIMYLWRQSVKVKDKARLALVLQFLKISYRNFNSIATQDSAIIQEIGIFYFSLNNVLRISITLKIGF